MLKFESRLVEKYENVFYGMLEELAESSQCFSIPMRRPIIAYDFAQWEKIIRKSGFSSKSVI